jgi:hypothetical protein
LVEIFAFQTSGNGTPSPCEADAGMLGVASKDTPCSAQDELSIDLVAETETNYGTPFIFEEAVVLGAPHKSCCCGSRLRPSK